MIPFGDLGKAVAVHIDTENEVISRHFWKVVHDKGDAATGDRFTMLKWCQEQEERDRGTQVYWQDSLVFVYPFVCFCCGQQISARQFGFSSYCGLCDAGRCKHHRLYTSFTQWPLEERAKIRPRISRFIDGQIVDLDLMDVMRLKRLRSWGGL